eukprot:Gb_28926 [translate_table: standard]
MTRKCSHCGHNGHNSRTCPNRGVKLFGVRLTDGPIRKSVSMGNLLHYSSSSNSASLIEPSESLAAAADGYVSDGLVHNSSSSNSRERKKGVPWTEEEHRMFLLGLQKLGKGDWRGISRNFVPTRTPTQVASHAQKYFIRQSNLTRRKRRSSLFDITAEPASCPIPVPSLPVLSSQSASDQEEAESVDNSENSADPETNVSQGHEMASGDPVVFPGFVTPYVPYGFPLWPTFRPTVHKNSNIFRPTAKVPTAPMKIDECTGLSQLSLGEAPGTMEPSELSLKLHGRPSRQSAFQASPPLNDSNNFSSSNNVISVTGPWLPDSYCDRIQEMLRLNSSILNKAKTWTWVLEFWIMMVQVNLPKLNAEEIQGGAVDYTALFFKCILKCKMSLCCTVASASAIQSCALQLMDDSWSLHIHFARMILERDTDLLQKHHCPSERAPFFACFSYTNPVLGSGSWGLPNCLSGLLLHCPMNSRLENSYHDCLDYMEWLKPKDVKGEYWAEILSLVRLGASGDIYFGYTVASLIVAHSLDGLFTHQLITVTVPPIIHRHLVQNLRLNWIDACRML